MGGELLQKMKKINKLNTIIDKPINNLWVAQGS